MSSKKLIRKTGASTGWLEIRAKAAAYVHAADNEPGRSTIERQVVAGDQRPSGRRRQPARGVARGRVGAHARSSTAQRVDVSYEQSKIADESVKKQDERLAGSAWASN